jgi:hypothetical protein
MRSKLIFTTLAILLGIMLKVAASSEGESTTRNSNSSIGDRRFFADIGKMKASFDEQGIPIDMQQGKVAGNSYAVVVDCPYSGPASADVYCYVLDDGTWRLYELLFVKRSLDRIDVKEKGDAIEIINDGNVLLTLNLSKQCEASFKFVHGRN